MRLYIEDASEIHLITNEETSVRVRMAQKIRERQVFVVSEKKRG